MRLLITGATGFVGRNLLLRMLAEGHEVYAPVRDPRKLREQLQSEGITEPPPNLHVLRPEPDQWGPIDVDHAVLGAGILFGRNRDEYFATNVDWTLRVLRALPETCRVVLLSSQSAGGPTPAHLEARRESDEDSPITWYGESKLAMERAVRAEPGSRIVHILRPPMVLGARDAATLPLFRMGRGFLRPKPGLRPKSYSFVSVDDLVDAILIALKQDAALPLCYVASTQRFTDNDLIGEAARIAGGRGCTLSVPHVFIRGLAMVVDAVPRLRAATPSLTRDRVKEIWPSRWIVDSSEFQRLTGWQPRQSLAQALEAACDYYTSRKLL